MPDSQTNHRILVVDDNPAIHEDIRKILGAAVGSAGALNDAKALLFGDQLDPSRQETFEIDSAFQGEEALQKVRAALEAGRPYALAFVDVRMPPGWDGVETIGRVWKENPEIQVVICTAYSDYSWEEMIRHLTKADNLVILKKPFDNIEVLQLAHALTAKWNLNHQVQCRLRDLDQLVAQRTSQLQQSNDQLKKEIAERIEVEKALRLSEERFGKAFKASPIPLAIISLRHERFLDINQGFQDLTGYLREEIIGRTSEALKLWAEPAEREGLLQALQTEMSIRNRTCRLRTKGGQISDVLLSMEVVELDGEPHLLAIAQDITTQAKLEGQLRQSQKMEAVGQLAAGVAHDFNNILTIVQGNASLMLATRAAESRDRKPLKTICDAAERASKLVRQLLTFSRKQFLQMQPMNLAETLGVVAELLPRVLGEHINVEVSAEPSLPKINADAAMMEQLLMNLAVNSRDAMPNGGSVRIRAELVELCPAAVRGNSEARHGRFVRLTFSDTGCGMPPEILAHIFEPFFTTKPVGKGTGLGLSTVYGIAKQHHGWIEVASEQGRGTTFNIFIPVLFQRALSGLNAASTEPPRGGTEGILIAEDEDEVRDFVVQVLTSSGYEVFSAVSGVEALELWGKHRDKIDLLITDMVMPGGVMGRQLADKLVSEDPDLRVIYTSGYSPGMASKDLALLEDGNFLPKPYRPAKLLQLVRHRLDNAPAPRSEVTPAV